MKTITKVALLGSMALGVAAWTLVAQDGDPSSPQRPPPGAGGGGGGGQRLMMMPLVAALDANRDGVIDADEIKNASAALLKLDKNGDGKLTREEFMGRPPGRPDGAPGGGRPDGPPPGGSPDRPDGKGSARFDGERPPFQRNNAMGDFRPPREGRDFGGPGERRFSEGRPGQRGQGERGFADQGPGQRGPGERGPAPTADSILEKFDSNKDGQLSKNELAVFLKDMQSHRPPPPAGGARAGGPPPEDGPPR